MILLSPRKGRKSIISPAVIITDEMISSSRLRPLSRLKSQRTTEAPTKIPNPMGRPRTPHPIGSWPYTLYDCVGQKRMTEKKLAPEMKVMMSVMARIRRFCHRRRGNMGYLAPHISQATKAKSRKIPRSKGTSTCAVCHSYYRNQPVPRLHHEMRFTWCPPHVRPWDFRSAMYPSKRPTPHSPATNKIMPDILRKPPM